MNAVVPVPLVAPAETVFHFDGQQVRVFDIGGEPWIAATDLARDLGYHEPDGTLVVEAGPYLAHVGGDSVATRSAGFTVETGWRGPPGSDEARR